VANPDSRFLDDITIPDPEKLLRRIPEYHYPYDSKIGRHRISSAAFFDPNQQISVDRRSISTPEQTRNRNNPDPSNFGVAAVTAALARQLQQMVVSSPSHTNPAHALIVGKQTAAVRKKLAKAATIEIEPPTN
jgi:hypothetical protein